MLYFTQPIFSRLLPLLLLSACFSTKSTPPLNYDDTINRQFWSADWSPDNRYVAVAGVDSTVRVFQGHDLKLYKSFPFADWLHVVKWHPDSRTLAVATLQNYVQLLDIQTGQFTKLDNQTGPYDPNQNGSRAIGWNRTGDRLAVGGLDGVVKIWDQKGRLQHFFVDSLAPDGPKTYLALDWHHTENTFVAANSAIHLFDGEGRRLRSMEHTNPQAIMLCAAWHPSGDFFVIGDYGHNWEGENVPSLLHFWTPEGRLLRSVPGSQREYRNLDWSPDGRHLATASDVLRIWDKDGKLLHQSPADSTNNLWGISWNADGSRIVTASRFQTVALWDRTVRLLKRVDISK